MWIGLVKYVASVFVLTLIVVSVLKLAGCFDYKLDYVLEGEAESVCAESIGVFRVAQVADDGRVIQRLFRTGPEAAHIVVDTTLEKPVFLFKRYSTGGTHRDTLFLRIPSVNNLNCGNGIRGHAAGQAAGSG